MPEISAGAQIFDLIFHPTHSTVYTGLLTGHIKAFSYDDQGQYKRLFSLRPSKRSCRALTIDEDGSHLYAVGKSKALNIIDTVTQNVDTRPAAHESPINRIKYLMPWLLSTGDDDGVIKLWDPRQRECTRTYTQHFDYITDFLWLDDKKQLVATSGDGTLSVMDVRSKKPEPFAQSEDQEDELLSIVAIKGGTKVVVGTQIGILSIFNRSSGWGDCVDRVPGHPHSIDALCALPSSLPNVDTTSTILTGSSDGFVRAVQVLPTKLLGVVADHGDWPVERIAIGGGTSQLTLEGGGVDKTGGKVGGQTDEDKEWEEARNQRHGRWWVGSVGHEEVLRMTDLEAFFLDGQMSEAEKSGESVIDDGEQSEEQKDRGDEDADEEPEDNPAEINEEPEEDSDGDEDFDGPKVKKRKHKPEKDPLAVKKRKGKNTVDAEPAFFDGL
ncbi:WD repeat-containing protein JIP5 [Hypsizygus marmoreus]|uniref:WD repeat-containing protein JIP5 n=1 Tax=Hypsizygus marmoreus TaxID=39966 RepID=A0A369JPA8_HYPMA|nr:WD repeat-containing protein JIP5 [Hypsizygus marmoreus]